MLFFLNDFEMGQILRKSYDLMVTTFFGQFNEIGQIFNENSFALKMSHLQLN